MNEFLEQINSLNSKTIENILDILSKEEKIYNSYCEKGKKVLHKNNVFFDKTEKEIEELINLKAINYSEIKKTLEGKKAEYSKVIEESVNIESVDSEIKKFQKVKGMSVKAVRELLKRKIHEVESHLTILEKDFASKKKEIKFKKDDAKKAFKSKSMDIKRRNDKELVKLNKELDALILPLEQEMSPEKNKRRIIELKREIKKLRIKGYKEEKELRIKTLREKEFLEKESMNFFENVELESKVLEIYYDRRVIDLKSQKKVLQFEIDCELDLYDHRSVIKSYENIQSNFSENVDKRFSVNDEIDNLKKSFLDTKELEDSDRNLIYNKANEKFLENQTLLTESFSKFNSEILNKNIHGINMLKTSIIKNIENNYSLLETTLFDYYEYKNKFLVSLLEGIKTIKSSINNYNNFDITAFTEKCILEVNGIIKNQKQFLNEFKIELKTAFKEISKFITAKYEKIVTLHKLSIDFDNAAVQRINNFGLELIERINQKNLKDSLDMKNIKKEELDNIKMQYLDTINELDLLKAEFSCKCDLEISNQEVMVDDREKEYLLAKGKEIIERGNTLLENDKREKDIKLAYDRKISLLDKEITVKHNEQIKEVEKDILNKVKLL